MDAEVNEEEKSSVWKNFEHSSLKSRLTTEKKNMYTMW